MYRYIANSRLAVKLRRWHLFSRLGANELSIRSQMPWQWRLLLVLIIAILAILFGGKIYDEVRRTTGIGGGATAEEKAALIKQIELLVAELDAKNNATDAGLLVDQAANKELQSKIAALETENAKVKEELAVLERLGKGEDQADALSITNLKIKPQGDGGQYSYEFFVAQRSDKREQEFRGKLQILVHLQNSNKDVNMLMLPRPEDKDGERYNISFKYFNKVTGVFSLPEGTSPRSIEFRLLQGKSVRASKSVTL